MSEPGIPARSERAVVRFPAASASFELAAEGLARGQARDLVDEHDVADALVARELRQATALLELLGGDGLAVDQHDRGDDRLAELGVGHPEHRAVADARVAVQHRLDLGRRDLEAAHLHHLLQPVGDVQPPLGLEPADVAGAVPAVAERAPRSPMSGR